jgi:hypothetical protein
MSGECENVSCRRDAVWTAAFEFGDQWSGESAPGTSRFCPYHAAEALREGGSELVSLTLGASSDEPAFSVTFPIQVSERQRLAGFDPHPDVTADLLPPTDLAREETER